MSGKKGRSGRPGLYTPELASLICQRLAKGESLRSICRDEGMPDHSTVLKWVVDNENGFHNQYAISRDIALDIMADELLEIADTPVIGVRREESEQGVKEVSEDMLGHRRLQIDTRKWYLCKLAPKKYGDRQKIEHSGSIGLEALVNDDDAE